MELYIIYFIFMFAGLLCIGLVISLIMIQFMDIVTNITLSTERGKGNGRNSEHNNERSD